MKPDGTADDSDDDVPLSKMNPKPQGAGKETPTKAPEAGDEGDLPLSFLSATKAKPTIGDAPKKERKEEKKHKKHKKHKRRSRDYDDDSDDRSLPALELRASRNFELRETLKKQAVPDLMEKCKAAGISGYSNKRKDELINLLVPKKLRLDEQVYYARALDATGLLGFALCALRSVHSGTCSVASVRPSRPGMTMIYLSRPSMQRKQSQQTAMRRRLHASLSRQESRRRQPHRQPIVLRRS
jgi:hypothetical protein